MTIFRGPGGGGNANTDAEINALTAISLEATASALAASNAATAAAGSASTASTQATNASASASTASTQAGTATTQATNASSSASTASTQATNASNSAAAAAGSASTASTQASAAATSASGAATSASAASTSATNASSSASTASTQATNAASSASGANTSATNASNSATAASSSASTASTQASNASSSASAASTSASGAASSASAASTSASNAAASAASINPANFVLKTGNDTIAGVKTFTSSVVVASITYPDGSIQASAQVGFKNKLINAQGLINQRGVSGTVTLAAGVYGHDRFKAGAAGVTYTFATSANVVTFTITAGSLIQSIEGLNLQTGTFCLGWVGTAQGKIAAGSFAAAGVTASITGGTNTNIEFNTGTLSLPQFERGSVVSSFDYRDYGREVLLCQRYYYRLEILAGTGTPTLGFGVTASATTSFIEVHFKTTMRAPPSTTFGGALVITDSIAYNLTVSAIASLFVTVNTARVLYTHGTGGGAYRPASLSVVTNGAAFIDFLAEL